MATGISTVNMSRTAVNASGVSKQIPTNGIQAPKAPSNGVKVNGDQPKGVGGKGSEFDGVVVNGDNSNGVNGGGEGNSNPSV